MSEATTNQEAGPAASAEVDFVGRTSLDAATIDRREAAGWEGPTWAPEPGDLVTTVDPTKAPRPFTVVRLEDDVIVGQQRAVIAPAFMRPGEATWSVSARIDLITLFTPVHAAAYLEDVAEQVAAAQRSLGAHQAYASRVREGLSQSEAS